MRDRWVLPLACAAQGMVVLDVSVVNVALPSIRRTLGFAPGDEQWVVNGYLLVFAGLLLVGGRVADLYGRRRVLLGGLGLFTAASLAGGLASEPVTLVLARAAQGLGAAVLAPATLTVLTTTFPQGPRRRRALAAWTAVGLAGGTAGNLISGVLTQFGSWRWVLLVNVPIGALAIAAAAACLAADRPAGPRRRLDLPGAILVTAALVLLTHGITRSRTAGWTEPGTLVALGAGIAALAGFVAAEARGGDTALIPPGLFRLRAVAVGNVAMLLAGACLNPMWYFLTFTMQQVLHYDPLRTGLGFLPHTLLGVVVGTWLTPWLLGRVSAGRLIGGGALLAAAGFAWQATVTADSGYLAGILGPGVLVALGSGLLNVPLTTFVTDGVPDTAAGAASGVLNTAKQVGGSLGLAALIALAGTAATPADGYALAFLGMSALLVVLAALTTVLPNRTAPPSGAVYA